MRSYFKNNNNNKNLRKQAFEAPSRALKMKKLKLHGIPDEFAFQSAMVGIRVKSPKTCQRLDPHSSAIGK